MRPHCHTCGYRLVEGRCGLCTARRHIDKVERERDAWFTRANQHQESSRKRKAWAEKMEAQLRENGLEPVAADEVA